MSIEKFPESLSHAMLVGIILVGRLAVSQLPIGRARIRVRRLHAHACHRTGRATCTQTRVCDHTCTHAHTSLCLNGPYIIIKYSVCIVQHETREHLHVTLGFTGLYIGTGITGFIHRLIHVLKRAFSITSYHMTSCHSVPYRVRQRYAHFVLCARGCVRMSVEVMSIISINT